MGYNPDNECPICGSGYTDNIPVGSFNWKCRNCDNWFDNKTGKWQETGKPKKAGKKKADFYEWFWRIAIVISIAYAILK